ncbi:AraC family transcriptional regulator, partial [Salmonella enterica subsp. enterica serovar Eastbourne]|nr:AraC family transcriptional regulator [Salmonella enterica subsp. enterica serovar Eastbourne]
MKTEDRLRCLKQLLQTHTAERSGGWDTAVPGLALCRWTAPSQAQTWTY